MLPQITPISTSLDSLKRASNSSSYPSRTLIKPENSPTSSPTLLRRSNSSIFRVLNPLPNMALTSRELLAKAFDVPVSLPLRVFRPPKERAELMFRFLK